MTETEFELNDRVKIDGENGFYWVRGFASDGSVFLWGGDKDPGGRRQHRAVRPEQLSADTRRLERKAYPTPITNQEEDV